VREGQVNSGKGYENDCSTLSACPKTEFRMVLPWSKANKSLLRWLRDLIILFRLVIAIFKLTLLVMN
jgi:hypothetical protein